MSKKPLVSIIVPVYNVERYINRCLESLFSQTYTNIEYVFVDDCTPDNSVKIINDKLKQYPDRIKSVKILHHQTNMGLAAARKTGLTNATGDYIWHIDSDDYIDINAVEYLVNKAIESGMDMIVFNAKEIYTDYEKDVIQEIPHSKEEYLNKILTRELRFELWFRFCRKHIYQGIELDTSVCYAEDYATTPRLIYNANGVSYLNYVCYFYIKNNPFSYTNSITIHSIKSSERAIDVLSSFFLAKDPVKYAPILYNAQAFLKSHLLKASVFNDKSFAYAFNLYPFLSICKSLKLPFKDKIIILLSNLKCRLLLSVYIKVGIYCKRMIKR